MHNRYQTWVQGNAKGIGKRIPFLPSFDFCPLKAKAKDSLLAWCEEIASCRDFIRVTVTERRKARASSTNTNKLFSLLFLKLLDFKSLKRNISSEGHDSNDSKNQWAHGQVQKNITTETEWTLREWILRNLPITLHGQALANCLNPHQPVHQAGPNHQSATIYMDVMRCWIGKDAYINLSDTKEQNLIPHFIQRNQSLVIRALLISQLLELSLQYMHIRLLCLQLLHQLLVFILKGCRIHL